jgi:choline dehydrogenase-like flavoprotein
VRDKFDSFDQLYDAYRPTGTLRMSRSPMATVVDTNLRLWAFGNCYISNTAVFLSVWSARPKLIHLASTSHVAEHVSGVFAR